MARYILLPARGLRADTPSVGDVLAGVIGFNRSTLPPRSIDFGAVIAAAAPGLSNLSFGIERVGPSLSVARPSQFDVIDSIHEDGAKLVELDSEAAELFQRGATEARLLPVIEYDYNLAPPSAPVARPPGTTGTLPLSVECAATSAPIAGVKVCVLTDAVNLYGAAATTDAAGLVVLEVGAGPVLAEQLLIDAPASGHWGHYSRGRHLRPGERLQLAPLDAGGDPLAAWRGAQPAGGTPVRIAVIDSGIGPHPDLRPALLRNTVPGEPIDAGGDNGVGHGTHLAGTIAGQGAVFRGVAPDAAIHSYRVGGASRENPINYSIIKAMDRAADDCDIINLSLSTDADDTALRDAVRDVNLRGCVVVAAAGNGWRDPIGDPARFPEVIAVTAFGDSAAFPADSDAARFVAVPAGTVRPTEFVAAFSNVGGRGGAVSLTAPGVGIIATGLGGGMRVMHGTSMATAVVSAQIAALLARNPQILAMPRDHARSVAIRQLAFAAARPRGFGVAYEGYGAL